VNEADVGKRLLSDFHSLGQALKVVQPNDLVLYAKDIREPALWQPPGKRHLATLELWLSATRSMVSGARLHSLVSLA
jgi:hypothetical protein